MWEPTDPLLPKAPWIRFPLDRVLLEYDGPRLLLRRTEAGQHYLIWWSASEGPIHRWIYLPLSVSRLHSVLSGDMPTLDALRSPEDGYILIVDEDIEMDQTVRVYITDVRNIPEGSLPRANARLNLPIPDDLSSIPMRDRAHLIDITLASDMVQTGRVRSRVLGQFLANFQRLVDALGQASLGTHTLRGNIPAEILEQTRLDVVSSYPGSFGVRLEAYLQDDLLGDSLPRRAINSLFNLMEAGDDLSKLTEQLQILRGRVAHNYDALLATIEASTPSASLRWAQGWQPSYRHISLTRQQAHEIRMRIRDAETSIEDTFSVTGELLAINLRTFRFEIREIETQGLVSGRIDEDASRSFESVTVRSICEIVLRPESEVSAATGEEQVRYTALNIRHIDGFLERQPGSIEQDESIT